MTFGGKYIPLLTIIVFPPHGLDVDTMYPTAFILPSALITSQLKQVKVRRVRFLETAKWTARDQEIKSGVETPRNYDSG